MPSSATGVAKFNIELQEDIGQAVYNHIVSNVLIRPLKYLYIEI